MCAVAGGAVAVPLLSKQDTLVFQKIAVLTRPSAHACIDFSHHWNMKPVRCLMETSVSVGTKVNNVHQIWDA